MSVPKLIIGVENMIEAVKSTLAQATIAKLPLEQNSALKSFSANPSRVQEVPEAPYVSPTVRVDVNTKIAILEFREADTGDVLLQVPSEHQIRAYQTRKARQDAELEIELSSKSAGQQQTQQIGGGQPQEQKVSDIQIEREVQAKLNAQGSGNSKPIEEQKSV